MKKKTVPFEGGMRGETMTSDNKSVLDNRYFQININKPTWELESNLFQSFASSCKVHIVDNSTEVEVFRLDQSGDRTIEEEEGEDGRWEEQNILFIPVTKKWINHNYLDIDPCKENLQQFSLPSDEDRWLQEREKVSDENNEMEENLKNLEEAENDDDDGDDEEKSNSSDSDSESFNRTKCWVCGKLMWTKHLKAHMLQHPNNNTNTASSLSKTKDYKCEYCARNFSSRGRINQHKKTCGKNNRNYSGDKLERKDDYVGKDKPNARESVSTQNEKDIAIKDPAFSLSLLNEDTPIVNSLLNHNNINFDNQKSHNTNTTNTDKICFTTTAERVKQHERSCQKKKQNLLSIKLENNVTMLDKDKLNVAKVSQDEDVHLKLSHSVFSGDRSLKSIQGDTNIALKPSFTSPNNQSMSEKSWKDEEDIPLKQLYSSHREEDIPLKIYIKKKKESMIGLSAHDDDKENQGNDPDNQKRKSAGTKKESSIKAILKKDGPSFPCNLCSKTFQTIYRLKRHKLSHSGEKKFKCDVCGRGFVRKDYVQDHQRHWKGKCLEKYGPKDQGMVDISEGQGVKSCITVQGVEEGVGSNDSSSGRIVEGLIFQDEL